LSVYTNPSSGAAEHAAAYVAAVLDLLGQRDPLAVLEETPAAISRAIEGLSAEQLDQPEGSGKWSITQILQHLADSENASGVAPRESPAAVARLGRRAETCRRLRNTHDRLVSISTVFGTRSTAVVSGVH
jgi:hypothetical protein